jgi:hypothetical protein
VAYLVECRTSSVAGTLDAERVAARVLGSLLRSEVVREPGIALDPRTRRLTMTARIERARTSQLAAVAAANELLWRANELCGVHGSERVTITNLASRPTGSWPLAEN